MNKKFVLLLLFFSGIFMRVHATNGGTDLMSRNPEIYQNPYRTENFLDRMERDPYFNRQYTYQPRQVYRGNNGNWITDTPHMNGHGVIKDNHGNWIRY